VKLIRNGHVCWNSLRQAYGVTTSYMEIFEGTCDYAVDSGLNLQNEGESKMCNLFHGGWRFTSQRTFMLCNTI
jgi:hypothetical protein